jgi:hypothetical protein
VSDEVPVKLEFKANKDATEVRMFLFKNGLI